MNELALFAGAGGGILGGHLLGWRTICAVEYNAYARSILLARQNDGTLPPFPVWDDIRTFDGKPWRGIVDVVSGGFPCQDISVAGKGDGLDGERSGLWTEMARVVREVRPRFVFVENSPMLTSRGLDRVLGDLASMGFDAQWGVLGADDVGAPHRRKRIWILAYATNEGFYKRRGFDGSREDVFILGGNESDGLQSCGKKEKEILADSSVQRHELTKYKICTRRDSIEFGYKNLADSRCQHEQREFTSNADTKIGAFQKIGSSGSRSDGIGWWQVEPRLGRVADGVAHRVDRLKAIGNGQVPAVAATAWKLLNKEEK